MGYGDINANGKLDSNFIGIPKEPVGFSNNCKGKFGPPKYEDCAFKIYDKSIEMTVELTEI